MVLLFRHNLTKPILNSINIIVVYTINNIAYKYKSIAALMRAISITESLRTSGVRT